MNIKALLLTGLLTVGSATPALALDYPGDRPQTTPQTTKQFCYFSTNREAPEFTRNETYECTVTTRKNVNGHWVWDVQAGDLKTTVVLWNDGKVEYWQEGNRYTGTHVEWNGDQTIVYHDHSDYHFAF